MARIVIFRASFVEEYIELRIPLERNSQSAIAVRLSAPNGKDNSDLYVMPRKDLYMSNT